MKTKLEARLKWLGCAEEEQWICWNKGVEYGAAREEKKKKPTEKVQDVENRQRDLPSWYDRKERW